MLTDREIVAALIAQGSHSFSAAAEAVREHRAAIQRAEQRSATQNRRERVAVAALSGLVADGMEGPPTAFASAAVVLADALIEELDK